MISFAFVRWFTINIPVVTYVRNALQVTNQGPNPPAVLYLSDGGHIENLGILPLLKKRLQKIVHRWRTDDPRRRLWKHSFGSFKYGEEEVGLLIFRDGWTRYC